MKKLIIIVLCLALIGCSSRKSVQASKLEAVRSVILKQDSTAREYVLERITHYTRDTITMIEERTRLREIAKAVQVHDTLYLQRTDTLYLEKHVGGSVGCRDPTSWWRIGVMIALLACLISALTITKRN